MKKDILRSLDNDLEALKESVYQQNSLRLEKDDLIILKSINEKFKDIVGLINFIARNQHELCTANSKHT